MIVDEQLKEALRCFTCKVAMFFFCSKVCSRVLIRFVDVAKVVAERNYICPLMLIFYNHSKRKFQKLVWVAQSGPLENWLLRSVPFSYTAVNLGDILC